MPKEIFEDETAPAKERRAERDRETELLYRKAVLALLDAANGKELR